VRRALLALAGAGAAALAAAAPASAHGIGTGVGESPLPPWLMYFGSAAVLVASFAALGVLWSRAILDRVARGRPVGETISRVLLSPVLATVIRAMSVALLVAVWASAAFGTDFPTQNFAPTFVYVVFWLGMPLLSVLLGNVWSVLNPWRAVFPDNEGVWEYPQWLGYYPAAVGLFSFAALELGYYDPSDPRALALAISISSAVAWGGAALFGRDVWFRYGDGFSVYFGLLAAMAPLARREDRIVVRAPISGLATVEHAPGLLGFIAVALGSVAFDGFSRTQIWQRRVYSVQSHFLPDRVGRAELATTLLNLGGLLCFVWAVALVFIGALEIARRMGRGDRTLAEAVLPSLVPIAFAYLIAHYFALFIYQGQFAVPLASDPLGRGWDLLGTAGVTPNLTLLSTNTIWYVQGAALIVGHICGLTVAHDRALAALPRVRDALRSQYAILVLMVFYTVGGFWLLSRP
jgi:hypothetical protein